jgi:hypothetical protein
VKEDEIPEGLAPGMERYLRRGYPKPNEQILEVVERSGGVSLAAVDGASNGAKM